MVDENRLVAAASDVLRSSYPAFQWRAACEFETHGAPVLMCDPIYLADVYNSSDPASDFLRTRGVVLTQFGGDASGPVWWKDPYLVIPLSLHYGDDGPTPEPGVMVLAESMGCDSGSFVFFPITKDVPSELQREMMAVMRDRNGVLIRLPVGRYVFAYEQFDAEDPDEMESYRNIVAVRS